MSEELLEQVKTAAIFRIVCNTIIMIFKSLYSLELSSDSKYV